MAGPQGRWGSGRAGGINRHGKGDGDTSTILEAAAWAAELGCSHPGCDGESIRWRNGATAYKGNKERQRRRIFICPSSHSQRRRFITGVSCKITLFLTPEQTEAFVWVAGQTIRVSRSHHPTGGHHHPPAAQPCGGGAGPESLPITATHWSPPWLRGDEPKLTFSCLGLMCTAEALLQAGDGCGRQGIRLLEGRLGRKEAAIPTRRQESDRIHGGIY